MKFHPVKDLKDIQPFSTLFSDKINSKTSKDLKIVPNYLNFIWRKTKLLTSETCKKLICLEASSWPKTN